MHNISLTVNDDNQSLRTFKNYTIDFFLNPIPLKK